MVSIQKIILKTSLGDKDHHGNNEQGVCNEMLMVSTYGFEIHQLKLLAELLVKVLKMEYRNMM